MKILLHACCAVCSGYPIELLRSLGYEPLVYFFNPNIQPIDEYNRRLDELIRYSRKKQFELIIETDKPGGWRECIKGLENEPERGKRCIKCFEYRLNAAAKKAKDLKICQYTTTLTVSRHKISKDIFAAGKKAADICGVEFLEIDFKKKDGFLKTMQIAKEENFYRQTYCGCRLHQQET